MPNFRLFTLYLIGRRKPPSTNAVVAMATKIGGALQAYKWTLEENLQPLPEAGDSGHNGVGGGDKERENKKLEYMHVPFVPINTSWGDPTLPYVVEKRMAFKQCLHEQMKGAFSSTLYLSLSFFISVLILLKLARRTRSKTKLNLPPSPPKLPIIGNLHQFGTLPHRSLRDLSLKYGDMMMLQLGQMKSPTLVVSSVDVAKEILKNHDLAFSNRPQNTAAKILLYGCSDVGFARYGEDWRQKRKICVLELLSMKRVQSFRAMREEEVAEFVDKLREASSSDACVNLSDMLISTTNNIVCKCTLGKKYTEDGYNRVKELARDVMIYVAAFTVRDFFPWLWWVDVLTGKIQKYKATFKAMDALFDEVIAEHLTVQKEGEQSKRKDFLDILLQLQEDNNLNFELTKTDIKALLTVS
ncbi:hypothetical protein Fmac_026125 [Flemingia macrophylla]|uniref:Cytochrome P450 n=1 Tax=Flemingia macrophylla TaxID=520843 RepID=A0ABD1LDY2_9FABA